LKINQLTQLNSTVLHMNSILGIYKIEILNCSLRTLKIDLRDLQETRDKFEIDP